MGKKLMDDFIEYAKKTFGVAITVKKSLDYDTFDKIFGELPEKIEVGQYRNELISCDSAMNAVYPVYDTTKELIRAA